ncbi:hypothetical protein B0T26DRAFT_676530 [Lasiosphaeria miniovina]|uniref:Uncharacterized protein n=1 Tax=Lasiosphaeria miniovina TaxID=1954250 RepID=A0AA40DWP1_9PEZI|nr:uncharacterized protein B0T26DRAFT_676530 [Lasiosphaeria miniovina]KAK0718355.1 hypothetical protein B0T26DRAFT_676530 [Lasiosphaeria miniovina]
MQDRDTGAQDYLTSLGYQYHGITSRGKLGQPSPRRVVGASGNSARRGSVARCLACWSAGAGAVVTARLPHKDVQFGIIPSVLGIGCGRARARVLEAIVCHSMVPVLRGLPQPLTSMHNRRKLPGSSESSQKKRSKQLRQGNQSNQPKPPMAAAWERQV